MKMKIKGDSQYVIEEARQINAVTKTNKQKVDKVDKVFLTKLGIIYMVSAIVMVLFN